MAASKSMFKGKKKVIFCDFDGVLTSKHETPGSYVNYDSEYGISPSCFSRLEELCLRTKAVVVISSNWRRFDDDGKWSYCTFDGVHAFKNQLPKLREMLGKLYAGTLPLDRHITKAQALVLWFEEHPEFKGEFVIFDDDKSEGLQDTFEHDINEHFILTDPEWGLSDADVEEAADILCPNGDDDL